MGISLEQAKAIEEEQQKDFLNKVSRVIKDSLVRLIWGQNAAK